MKTNWLLSSINFLTWSEALQMDRMKTKYWLKCLLFIDWKSAQLLVKPILNYEDKPFGAIMKEKQSSCQRSMACELNLRQVNPRWNIKKYRVNLPLDLDAQKQIVRSFLQSTKRNFNYYDERKIKIDEGEDFNSLSYMKKIQSAVISNSKSKKLKISNGKKDQIFNMNKGQIVKANCKSPTAFCHKCTSNHMLHLDTPNLL